MFKGIIRHLGVITGLQSNNRGEIVLTIKHKQLGWQLGIGDSVACNGVCLTVTEVNCDSFTVYVSCETYTVTCAKHYKIGDFLNLEPSLRFGDAVDGHLTQGHVDGAIKISDISVVGESHRLAFYLQDALSPFITKKCSISIDGVSLTVNDVVDAVFTVNIIPYTFENTVFQYYKINDFVNVEVDLIARYLLNFYKNYRG